jgi:hypothetical protein
MKSLLKILPLVTLLSASQLKATPHVHSDKCSLFDNLTPTTMNISYSDFYNTDKTPEKFERFTNRIVGLFSDTIKGLGGNIQTEFLWDSPELNAYAGKNGSEWKIVFHGALYRDKRVTDDGFIMTVCHELGHLLGGAPFKLGQETSAEGQADYWASSVCAKKYFTEYPENVVMSNGYVRDQCTKKYDNDLAAQKICYRTTMAGYSLATFLGLQSQGKQPRFETPDKHVLDVTDQLHPLSQCRLDTFLAGALCELEDSSLTFEQKILGDKLTTDFKCSEVVEGQLTIVDKRPKCWFNEINNSVFAKYEPKVKAKTLFGGLQGGHIYIDYDNHLPGEYKIKLEPETFSAAYIKVTTLPYVQTMAAASGVNNLRFDYKFLRTGKKDIKLNLIVEYKGKVILKRVGAISLLVD